MVYRYMTSNNCKSLLNVASPIIYITNETPIFKTKIITYSIYILLIILIAGFISEGIALVLIN